MTTLYTIGHSNRSSEALIALLSPRSIGCVADVRAVPASRRFPQFSKAPLAAALNHAGVAYLWLGKELGGLRQHVDGAAAHTALPPAFRDFAAYMATVEFARGIEALLAQAEATPTVILCAERSPSDCHRGLISDYLVTRGHQVTHVLDSDHCLPHALHPSATMDSQHLRYAAPGDAQLRLL